MKFPHLLGLLILGLGVTAILSIFQPSPGYMDADYYFLGGVQLVEGRGFTDPVLWNYLDDPQGLPHPSHAYWMPLASLLAAGGMFFTRQLNFAMGQIPFLFLAGCVPPLTAALSFSLTRERRYALLAGILAAFSGLYLPFMTTSDTFGIYMLCGGAFLLILPREQDPEEYDKSPSSTWRYPLLGVLVGLMHLARADGMLWLVIALFAGLRLVRPRRHYRHFLAIIGLHFLGYLIIMGPWIIRNLGVFGTPLSPGGMRALWLTDYDELFTYPGSLLTFERWWSAGLGELLCIRIWSGWQNLGNAFAVQGGIFLAPLIAVGLWIYRDDLRVKSGLLAWTLILLVMTLIFPWVGARGGFFHSGAAVQPLFWALAPVGLDRFIRWGSQRRGWQMKQAWSIFSVGLIGLAVLVSSLVVSQRVIGADPQEPVWDTSTQSYADLDKYLTQIGDRESIVLVNNPPGFALANGRPAIVIPNGDVETLLAVANRYGVTYLLLEPNHPRPLEGLYLNPGDRPGLRYLDRFEGTDIYLIDGGSSN